MEPFIFLFIAFAVLGFLDIVGFGKIGVNYILFFAFAFLVIFLYNISFNISNFIASLSTIELIGTFGSIIVILIWPRLGLGDKIFLATTFLVYPFWLMWAIILLAMVLTKPIFKLIGFIFKLDSFALPFYPFLFLSTLIVFFVASVILGYGALLPAIPPLFTSLGL